MKYDIEASFLEWDNRSGDKILQNRTRQDMTRDNVTRNNVARDNVTRNNMTRDYVTCCEYIRCTSPNKNKNLESLDENRKQVRNRVSFPQ